jgi:hypothetical protein
MSSDGDFDFRLFGEFDDNLDVQTGVKLYDSDLQVARKDPVLHNRFNCPSPFISGRLESTNRLEASVDTVQNLFP